MALIKTVDFRGITVENAVIRVTNLTIYYWRGRMEFSGEILSGLESEAFDVLYEECDYDINGDNPIKQAYNYLKTLDRFAGAVDD